MIREAKVDDCFNLAALSIQVWLETYAVEGIRSEYSRYALTTFTESHFESLLCCPDHRLLVSEVDGVLQGFALVNLSSRYNGNLTAYEVEKLYVHAKFQGQGIGRSLVAELQKRYGSNIWLYTWVENKSNQFYKQLGFQHIGRLDFEFNGQAIENNVFALNCT